MSPPEPPGLSPVELDTLARYNAEKYRGVTHTPAFAADMHVLQERFDARMAWLDRDTARLDAVLEWEIRTRPPRWLMAACAAAVLVSMVVLIVQAVTGNG